MTGPQDRRANRDRDKSRQRGATLVEFILGATLLLLLIFGVIEWGMTMEGKASLGAGVRDTARAGVVGDVDAGTGCSDLACQAVQRIDLPDAAARVTVSGNQLTVCGVSSSRAVTGLLRPFLGGELTSSVTMRIEDEVSLAGGEAGNTSLLDGHC